MSWNIFSWRRLALPEDGQVPDLVLLHLVGAEVGLEGWESSRRILVLSSSCSGCWCCSTDNCENTENLHGQSGVLYCSAQYNVTSLSFFYVPSHSLRLLPAVYFSVFFLLFILVYLK